MVLLKHEINRGNRSYYIEGVNLPLRKAIRLLSLRYPEPTADNLWHPNSQRLFRMYQNYLRHEMSAGRRAMVEAGFRILIVKYEHSRAWRDVIDYLIELLFSSNWKRLNPARQMYYWNKDVLDDPIDI